MSVIKSNRLVEEEEKKITSHFFFLLCKNKPAADKLRTPMERERMKSEKQMLERQKKALTEKT